MAGHERVDGRRGCPGRHRPGADAGVTFIEIVITIALMGIIVVPILLATITAIKSSKVSEQAAQVETLLVNAVDRVNRTTRDESKCDFSSQVSAAVETAGWPASNATVVQEFLNGSGTWEIGASGTACPPVTGYSPGLVQRITVTITSLDGDVTRSLQVVKGDL